MRKYMCYKCEFCKHITMNENEMEIHEAKHLGVTPAIMHKWMSLKSKVKYIKTKVDRFGDKTSIYEYDKICTELVNFEKINNISYEGIKLFEDNLSTKNNNDNNIETKQIQHNGYNNSNNKKYNNYKRGKK